MRDEKAIVVRQVVKAYWKGASMVVALDGVNLKANATGILAIVGPSGSGKSTLLHLIGAMDRPTRGEIIVAGQALNRLSERDFTRFRRTTVGFVFQTFNLIPNLTALQNVTLAMEFNQVPRRERRERACQLLERVELGQRLEHKPAELSGGEMQRVAIARALANNPHVILADEPTGNLDSQTGERIYALLRIIAEERTVVVVTHAQPLASLADRVVHLKDGRVAAQATEIEAPRQTSCGRNGVRLRRRERTVEPAESHRRAEDAPHFVVDGTLSNGALLDEWKQLFTVQEFASRHLEVESTVGGGQRYAACHDIRPSGGTHAERAIGGAQRRHAESRDAAHVAKVHASEQVELFFERHAAQDGLDAALDLSRRWSGRRRGRLRRHRHDMRDEQGEGGNRRTKFAQEMHGSP